MQTAFQTHKSSPSNAVSSHLISPIVATQLSRRRLTADSLPLSEKMAIDEKTDLYMLRVNVNKNKPIRSKNFSKVIFSWFDLQSRTSGPYELDINHYTRIAHLLFGDYDGQTIHWRTSRQILSYMSLLYLVFEIFRLNATYLLGPYIVNFRWYITEPLLTYDLRIQNIVNSSYSTLMLGQAIISWLYLKFNLNVDQLSWWRMLMFNSLRQLQSRYWLTRRCAHHYFKYCKLCERLICLSALFFWLGICSFYIHSAFRSLVDQRVSFWSWVFISLPGMFLGSMSAHSLTFMYNQMYILYIYTCELMRQRLLAIQNHLSASSAHGGGIGRRGDGSNESMFFNIASRSGSVSDECFEPKNYSLFVSKCMALHNLIWRDYYKSQHFFAFTIGK